MRWSGQRYITPTPDRYGNRRKKNICGISLRHYSRRIIFTSYFRPIFILSSYLVIPKGKAADGKERESRLEAGALSSLFRRITGLRRDQHLIFWFWSDGRTDETGPDGSHTPLNWSIRKSWWSPRGSAGAFTVDRVQISLPSVFTSNSQEYNKFLLRLTVPSSLVLVRSSHTALYPSLFLARVTFLPPPAQHRDFDPQSIIVGGREKRKTGEEWTENRGAAELVARIFLKIMTSGCQLVQTYRCNPS